MGKIRKTRNLNISTPLMIWLLAGAFSVAVAAVGVMLYTPVVQADALLPRPIATAPPGPPILAATPASLAPKINPASSKQADLLHGVASWYGGVFNGRHTASGETFDMFAMTACHPTLPFGTIVRVTNRANNRSVVVRITDRGYLYKGRMLDLSYGAAEKLAILKSGTAKVDLEVLSLGEDRRRHHRKQGL
jgi:rare lipoprotein A